MFTKRQRRSGILATQTCFLNVRDPETDHELYLHSEGQQRELMGRESEMLTATRERTAQEHTNANDLRGNNTQTHYD